MDSKIIQWLSSYTGMYVSMDTTFVELKFDIFDETVTCDWCNKTFDKNINLHDEWYVTVKDLCDAIKNCS